jgi:4-hydroxy-3-polyprenylbenzoate decarboxylase
MVFQNLSEFIELLEKRGQLVRIKVPVSPILEITEITDRVSKATPQHNKALLFENLPGYDMPVLMNAFGSAERMAWALGVESLDELNQDLAKIIDLRLTQRRWRCDGARAWACWGCSNRSV